MDLMVTTLAREDGLEAALAFAVKVCSGKVVRGEGRLGCG